MVLLSHSIIKKYQEQKKNRNIFVISFLTSFVRSSEETGRCRPSSVYRFFVDVVFLLKHIYFRVHVTYLQKNTYNRDTCLQYIAYYLQRKH